VPAWCVCVSLSLLRISFTRRVAEKVRRRGLSSVATRMHADFQLRDDRAMVEHGRADSQSD
jgi:hypothetical protein